jgi:hypothetical protein
VSGKKLNRYRCQIEFDVYAKNDKKAIKKILKNIFKMEVNNNQIISVIETPFASLDFREISREKINDIILKEFDI